MIARWLSAFSAQLLWGAWVLLPSKKPLGIQAFNKCWIEVFRAWMTKGRYFNRAVSCWEPITCPRTSTYGLVVLAALGGHEGGCAPGRTELPEPRGPKPAVPEDARGHEPLLMAPQYPCLGTLLYEAVTTKGRRGQWMIWRRSVGRVRGGERCLCYVSEPPGGLVFARFLVIAWSPLVLQAFGEGPGPTGQGHPAPLSYQSWTAWAEGTLTVPGGSKMQLLRLFDGWLAGLAILHSVHLNYAGVLTPKASHICFCNCYLISIKQRQLRFALLCSNAADILELWN